MIAVVLPINLRCASPHDVDTQRRSLLGSAAWGTSKGLPIDATPSQAVPSKTIPQQEPIPSKRKSITPSEAALGKTLPHTASQAAFDARFAAVKPARQRREEAMHRLNQRNSTVGVGVRDWCPMYLTQAERILLHSSSCKVSIEDNGVEIALMLDTKLPLVTTLTAASFIVSLTFHR